MAFKNKGHMTKFDQLDRFVKQQLDPTTAGAGATSRQRTKQYLALGQAQAEQTKQAMRSSAQGVKRMFSKTDISASREDTLPSDLSIASWMQSIEQESEENKTEQDYNPLQLTEDLYGKKGVEAGKVASQSYFNEPLIEGGLRGNSRKAGDVAPAVQQEIVNRIINVGSQMGMSDYEIAYALATARHESGFNPDASAKSSSARGIGQFVNDTGKGYGITAENQWNADVQIQALLDHTVDNFETARKKGYGNEYVYALHHDGPDLNSGGLAIGKKNVMPFVPKYLDAIKKFRGEG